MRKLLGVTAGLALLFSMTARAQAEVLKNLKVTGAIEVQGRGVDNATDFAKSANDYEGQVGARLSVGGMFDLSDEVSARVSVYKNNRAWGDAGAAGTGGGAETVGTALLTSPWVGEANATVKGVFGLDHTIGRQYYGEGGDVLIRFGPTASHVLGLPTSGLDGWRADWKNEKVAVTALYGKMQTPATETFGAIETANTDQEVVGVQAMCVQSGSAVHPWLRAYMTQDHLGGPTTANSKTWFVGLGAKGGMMEDALTFTAEVLKNLGDSPTFPSPTGGRAKAQGLGFLGNVGYKADVGMGVLKLMGELGYGSGDDTAGDKNDKTFRSISSDYRPGLIWGGLSNQTLAGSFSGTNAAGLSGVAFGGAGTTTGTGLMTFNAGAKFSPAAWEKLWLGLHYYSFRANKITAGGEKSLGSEADLSATWKHSENTSVRFSAGTFMPGKGLVAAAGTGASVNMVGVDLSAKF